jgi:multiple sugar transport system substrate-binding protein
VIRLRGMTWRHDRGYAPMVATAKQFAADHPEVAIDWEARSLSEFGEVHADHLAETYDLVVLDHPYVGALAASRSFLALDEHLPPDLLRRHAVDSTGPSHASYEIDGHQWALAIDAAAQVAGYRADLFEREGVQVPQSWGDVLSLGGIRRGFVSLPLLPLDAFLAFCSICANTGEAPFSTGSVPLTGATAEYGLDLLQPLRECSVEQALEENPIAVWERMSTTDETAYCPLAFGYSNYSRPGYRDHRLTFGLIPSAGHGPIGATLGGAGLAVSARCPHRDVALAYAAWVASPECQSTLYVDAGGQPGSRAAWTSDHANAITQGYFHATLPVLEHAWLRPRHGSFPAFQTMGAEIVAAFLKRKISLSHAVDELIGQAGACIPG